MKTVSKLPDLMAQIEAKREEYRTCAPEERVAIQIQREALRDQLRAQRHLEHLADMERAQAMPEVCQFGKLLDPTPHRRHHVPMPRDWVTPVAACIVLVSAGTAFLMQFFDVLVLP